ncbi:MAG: hypothetical protein IT445_09540 [Phycisphaeraceae bacterium]|nr:hypothetical protein [Phycisphaeraceae bacterium]
MTEVGDTGLEPNRVKAETGDTCSKSPDGGAAKCAAKSPNSPPLGLSDAPHEEDPDLAELVRCWPALPAKVKADVLALIRSIQT